MKERETGTVASYNAVFAFIARDDVERDIFAHESELPDGISRGDRVSFVVAPDPYKPGKMLARDVRLEDLKLNAARQNQRRHFRRER
jgi:cold shock CspA family protein